MSTSQPEPTNRHSSTGRHRVPGFVKPLGVMAAVGMLAMSSVPAHAQDSQGKDAPSDQTRSHEVAADPNAGGYDQFIVTYHDGARDSGSARQQVMGAAAGKSDVGAHELRQASGGKYVLATDKKLNHDESQKFMDHLKETKQVESVEPDILLRPAAAGFTPNDPMYSSLWAFHGSNGVNVPGAWKQSDGEGATVAVIDTGITKHPDLDGNMVGGYDFISDSSSARDSDGRDANPQDEGDWTTAGECGSPRASNSSWHGSHVAGTIGAVGGNGVGVTGVAPRAKVEPVRALGKCGGRLSDISDAIVWASGGQVPGIPANPRPANVINMSLGGDGKCTPTYQNAINTAVRNNTSVVVAAGNESQPAENTSPASCQNVIAVGASGPDGAMAPYSNYGSAVDVTATGGNTQIQDGGILSTVNTGATRPAGSGYAQYQGTSMASPHVAGIAALMVSKNKAITPAQVEAALKKTTRPVPKGCPQGCGTGLVDAGKAVGAV